MNPNDLLGFLTQQVGNSFNGAWNAANQAALPTLRGLSNLASYPLGYVMGKGYGLSDEQMNNDYYNTVSKALISDNAPIADAFGMVMPDVQGALQGDPYAIAGFVPYAGRVARPLKIIGKGVKEGQKVVSTLKPALKAVKPAAKGVKPAKTKLGNLAQHVDRNAGKYYTGAVTGDLVSSMYSGNGPR